MACSDSLDNTYLFLQELNYKIYFNGNEEETVESDSVKQSLKIQSIKKPIEITPLVKLGTVQTIVYTIKPDFGGIISRDGVNLNGKITNVVAGEKIILDFSATQMSSYFIKFTALNDGGGKFASSYTRVLFDNLPPVAIFEITPKTSDQASLEYYFDATGSYDKDKKFGGGIQSYRYTITKEGVTPPEAEILGEVGTAKTPYVFPAAGSSYLVLLTVSDNEGLKSQPLTKEIVIP